MNWFTNHYEWVIAAVVVPVALVFLKHWLDPKKARTLTSSAELKSEGSSISSSPVASGKIVSQAVSAPVVNVNLGHPSATPTKPNLPVRIQPNIVFTVVKKTKITCDEASDVWSSTDMPYADAWEARVLQFTNEARSTGQNGGGFVVATLVYRDESGEEVERITGCWLGEAYCFIDFRVERIVNLIVAMKAEMTGEEVFTVENPRRELARYSEDSTRSVSLHGLKLASVNVKLTNADSGELLFTGIFALDSEPLAVTRKR